MGRIGSALALSLLALPALAGEVEFYMTADRNKVGTEDTFRLEIVVGNAPDGASLQFPVHDDVEVLSRSESTQMSYSVGPGGAGVIKQLRKYTLVMRAQKEGQLVIPAAILKTSRQSWKTDPVVMTVVKGRLGPSRPKRVVQNPFGVPGFPGFPGMGPDDEEDDPFGDRFPEPDIPRSNSDLFLRATLDRDDVYVGEQVTYTLLVYSRVDLSGVDAITMPKLEGFWTQDIPTPTQLVPRQKVIRGVPYREYVLRQKALFAMKSGDLEIDPAEADISTGFLFAGARVHRKGNELKVKVRALPPGGKSTIVGQWRLSSEVAQTDIALGDPVQVKVTLEGKGNLQAVQIPTLNAPSALKQYDPQTRDKVTVSRGEIGGSRTVEYVLVPQRTGTFEIPALSLPFFNPATKRYEESRTDPVTITVRAGAQGQTVAKVPVDPTQDDPVAKNVLQAGGLKSLRHTASFKSPPKPVWSQPFFLPLVLAPLALAFLGATVGFARDTFGRDTPEKIQQRQAKAARKRLAAAEKVLKSGSVATFYAEVEKALNSFLDAKLGVAVTGLTRAELDAKLTEHGTPENDRKRLLAVYETCDMGRYAPGMGEPAARRRALNDAAKAMETWT